MADLEVTQLLQEVCNCNDSMCRYMNSLPSGDTATTGSV